MFHLGIKFEELTICIDQSYFTIKSWVSLQQAPIFCLSNTSMRTSCHAGQIIFEISAAVWRDSYGRGGGGENVKVLGQPHGGGGGCTPNFLCVGKYGGFVNWVNYCI